MRKNPTTDKATEAKTLLAEIPRDKNGQPKGTGRELCLLVKKGLRLLTGADIDAWGNYTLKVKGESHRYHFTEQRVQYQSKAGGSWGNIWSLTPKECLARVIVPALAKASGDDEQVQEATRVGKAVVAQKKQAELKRTQRKAADVEAGLRALAVEEEHPELIQQIVLLQSGEANKQAAALLQSASPLQMPAPGSRFFLAPFAMPFAKASEVYSLRDGVSVIQVPVRDERQPLVRSCDLHIGDSKGSMRVSPRSHSVSFGAPSKCHPEGPGYLSATWDWKHSDDNGVFVHSDLFFLLAHTKGQGVGRALVQLWLDLARAGVGEEHGYKLVLRVVSIVPDAWPFWNKLEAEGVYTVSKRTATSLLLESEP